MTGRQAQWTERNVSRAEAPKLKRYAKKVAKRPSRARPAAARDGGRDVGASAARSGAFKVQLENDANGRHLIAALRGVTVPGVFEESSDAARRRPRGARRAQRRGQERAAARAGGDRGRGRRRRARDRAAAPADAGRLPDMGLLDWFRARTSLPEDEARTLLALPAGHRSDRPAAGAAEPGRAGAGARGGDRRRGSDLILLDEPTNHLDFDTLEVIEAALRAYTGTIVVASHDRTLLKAVGCDRVLEVRGGRGVRRGSDDHFQVRRGRGAADAGRTRRRAGGGARLRRDDHVGHQAPRRPHELPGRRARDRADHVTLDLGRKTIDGSGAGVGIKLAGHRGVKIKGGTVQEFGVGIALDAADGNRLSGLAVKRSAGRGIDVVNGSDRKRSTASPRPATARASRSRRRRATRAAEHAVGQRGDGRARVGAAQTVCTAPGHRQRRERDRVRGGLDRQPGPPTGSRAPNEHGHRQLRRQHARAQQGQRRRGQRAGRGQPQRRGRRPRGSSVGGCEDCIGHGIGVAAGEGNAIKANVVTRSAGDGINVAAPTTVVSRNVATRNAGLGINAVAGVVDGGGTAPQGTAARRSAWSSAAVVSAGTDRTRGGKTDLGEKRVGMAAGIVVVGDRDHDHLLRAVRGRDLLEPGPHLI